MEKEAYSSHVIAASNMIYGVANFIVLRLPPEWRISPSLIHPEVDVVNRVGDVLWVVTGSSINYMVNMNVKKS